MSELVRLFVDRIKTPIGELVFAADSEGKLRVVDWTDYEDRMLRLLKLHYGDGKYRLVPTQNPGGVRDRLELYFCGDVQAIDEIEVESAGTAFQRAVWKELRSISSGAVISYSQLAGRIGRPKAVRAVGLANGSNPIGIVVPCHRVIGADGSLTGYGGGLARKRWLLDHEQRNAGRVEEALGGLAQRQPGQGREQGEDRP